MKKFICLLISFNLVLVAFAQSKMTSSNPQVTKGIEIHDKARSGNFNELQKALTLLEPYTKTDSVACAYYGSCLTLCAAECVEDNPIKALEYLDKGGKYLDEAVKLDSKNPAIRLMRLENGIEVSRTSPVKRYSVVADDVDFLMKTDMTGWDAALKAEVYLFCGYFQADAGDLDGALDLFDCAIEADPDSAPGKSAQKMIDKYSE